MKPVIGITCGNAPGSSDRTVEAPAPVQYVQRPFIRCVEKSGGIPLLLPCLDNTGDYSVFLDLIHGLLVPGGVDADPRFFGATPHRNIGTVDPEKDELELDLIRACAGRGLPVLGLCRGIQMLAIAFGGNIIQDLSSDRPLAFNHMQTSPMTFHSHEVAVEPDSLLHGILGDNVVSTNSSHHQAVDSVPEGFAVSGRTSDGVVEGLENGSGRILGVQWHPERTYDRDRWSPAIFAWLIGEAKSGRD